MKTYYFQWLWNPDFPAQNFYITNDDIWKHSGEKCGMSASALAHHMLRRDDAACRCFWTFLNEPFYCMSYSVDCSHKNSYLVRTTKP